MITNRVAISDLRATHRLLSSDGSLNDRALLSALRNTCKTLIRRELNLRKLTTTDSIYTVIPCLELQEVPLSECCEYVDESTIARTKYPLPRIEESNYQLAIQGVFSINQSRKLIEITPSRYINLLKLPKRVNEVYYWFQNNYLYVTSPEVEIVKLVAYFSEEVPKSILYPKDCDSCKCGKIVSKEDLCKNPLDEEFKCPGYLIDNVMKMTSEYLLKTYFNLKQDFTDNGSDAQARNSNEQAKQ